MKINVRADKLKEKYIKAAKKMKSWEQKFSR